MAGPVVIEFFVAGVPMSQGSMRAFVRGGHAVVTSDNTKLKPWRDAVNSAFQREFTALESVPVEVQVWFVLPRPKSFPKTKPTVHTKKPDLDKLIRAILDAGTGVAWSDDACVDSIRAAKRYAAIGEQSGALIRVIGGPE